MADKEVERGPNHQIVLTSMQARQNGIYNQIWPVRVVEVLIGTAQQLSLPDLLLVQRFLLVLLLCFKV